MGPQLWILLRFMVGSRSAHCWMRVFTPFSLLSLKQVETTGLLQPGKLRPTEGQDEREARCTDVLVRPNFPVLWSLDGVYAQPGHTPPSGTLCAVRQALLLPPFCRCRN